jgi:hypothetical protein
MSFLEYAPTIAIVIVVLLIGAALFYFSLHSLKYVIKNYRKTQSLWRAIEDDDGLSNALFVVVSIIGCRGPTLFPTPGPVLFPTFSVVDFKTHPANLSTFIIC